MGAGCNYTHKCNGEKAYWIEVPQSENDPEQWEYDQVREDIGQILESLGYTYYGRSRYAQQADYMNGLFSVFLESTYYGDGLIVRLEPRADNDYYQTNLYNLAMANHARAERKIAKALNQFYPLSYATSGWTAATIQPKELN